MSFSFSLRNGLGFTRLNIHPASQYVVLATMLKTSAEGLSWEPTERSMQNPALGLLRMYLPRTPLNKGIRKGREDRFGTPMGGGLGLRDVLARG